MSYVVAAPAPVTVPVQGEQAVYPVRRVYCVGRNYAEHAREMGYDPDREPPFFFCKPADAIRPAMPDETLDIPYPPQTSNLHYEVEMVVALGVGGTDIAVEDALSHVYGYAIGIDMTRRDRQQEAKDRARPWEISKAFDASAPISQIVPVAQGGHPVDDVISLLQNGQQRQHGRIDQMIWSVAESISFLSRYFRLEPGDLIFTGTPDGVGPAVAGDVLEVRLGDRARLSVRLV